MNLSRTPNFLTSRSQVIGFLKRHGLYLKKSLGQNFLVDPGALNRIVATLDLSPEDAVLEVGPGIGTMTRALAERAGAVVAIEYDPRFFPLLEETLVDCPNARVVHGDVLKTDLRRLLLDFGERRRKAAANLPYYITAPALTRLLEQRDLLERIVVLVQKEVADRLSARPGTKDYGSLSVFAQYHAHVETVATVPNTAFLPPPRVTSAIVRMTIHPAPIVSIPDEAIFFQGVKAAFGQRRKTLLNALRGGLPYAREEIKAALQAANLEPMRRGETLNLDEFAALARGLYAIRSNITGERDEKTPSWE